MSGIQNINHQSLYQATQQNSSNPISGPGSQRPSGVANRSEPTQYTVVDSNVILANQSLFFKSSGGQAAPAAGSNEPHEQIEHVYCDSQGCFQALLPSASAGLGVGIVAGGCSALTSVATVASANALYNAGTSLATAAQIGAVGGSILGGGIGSLVTFVGIANLTDGARHDVVFGLGGAGIFTTLFSQPAANLIGNAALASPLTVGAAASAGVGGTVLATTLLATSYLCRE